MAAPTISAKQPRDKRLPKRRRLTRTAQFEHVYAQRRRMAGRWMALWLADAPDTGPRLGVVASRRIGNAPSRNLAKRRLRELFRLNRHRFREAADLVLVAQPGIGQAAWADLNEDLIRLAGHAGLLKNDDRKESS